jgi:hypothetical protein
MNQHLKNKNNLYKIKYLLPLGDLIYIKIAAKLQIKNEFKNLKNENEQLSKEAGRKNVLIFGFSQLL